MNADSMVAGKAADLPYLNTLAHALLDGALPDEVEGFGTEDAREAAEFVAACARQRPPGIALVRLESVGGAVGQRRMRLCVVNDDMPFLLDSVVGELNQRGLDIRLLVHPVFAVERDAAGMLTAFKGVAKDGGRHESFIHVHVDRIEDAQQRDEIASAIEQVMADIRLCVADWRPMVGRVTSLTTSLKVAVEYQAPIL